MRGAALVYLTLFAYPAVTLLVPNPYSIKWWWKTGGHGSMPPDIIERCKQNQGNLLIVKFLFLMLACFVLMKQSVISPKSLGFKHSQPQGMVLIGLAAGALLMCWIWSMYALATKMKLPREGPPYLIQEGVFKILMVLVLGGFAEEYWRALSLIVFHRAGVSDLYTIFITSIIFGIGHVFSYKSFGAAVGRALAPAIGGAFLAILFLWWQTLFIPLIAHVMLNSFGTLMRRKRLWASADQ